MKVLKIREIGDPVLEKVCDEVDLKKIKERRFTEFLEDLKSTLEDSGALGLAAPQVGVSLRVIAIKVHITSENNNSYKEMEEIPLTVLINPRIRRIEGIGTSLEYEACASVPEITGKVRRDKKVLLEYYTEEGTKVQKIVKGYYARLVQHECDHLDGINFLEKVEGKFATKAMVKKFNLKEK